MSEAKKRRIYTKEFKQDALNLSEQPGYTAVLAAKNLGIPEGLLYKWRGAAAKSGSLAFPGNGKEALTDAERENRELRKRLKDAEMERDILKKSSGRFLKSTAMKCERHNLFASQWQAVLPRGFH